MSYENTNCPCGGKKERETLICAKCEETFADTYELRVVKEATADICYRRSSAIKLLSMARRRNRREPYRLLSGATI